MSPSVFVSKVSLKYSTAPGAGRPNQVIRSNQVIQSQERAYTPYRIQETMSSEVSSARWLPPCPMPILRSEAASSATAAPKGLNYHPLTTLLSQ